MHTAITNTGSKVEEEAKERVRKRIIFWDSVNIIFKTTGMLTWFIIFLLAILEIKRYFNIDFIPGYDSALDDMYGTLRGKFRNL